MRTLLITLKFPVALQVTEAVFPEGERVRNIQTRILRVEWPTRPDAMMGALKPAQLIDDPLVPVQVTGLIALHNEAKGRLWDFHREGQRYGGPQMLDLSIENVIARQELPDVLDDSVISDETQISSEHN